MSPETNRRPMNAMTVDVEDYFQVSAFDHLVDRARWDEFECRVEANTHRLLELFAKYDTHATFFTLGWVAERYPALIRAIAAAGHEIASHGYEHRLVHRMTAEDFRDDLTRAKDALTRAADVSIDGFRAPSFSLCSRSMWALDVLAEEGYSYSSSIFPVRHDRYGIPNFPRYPVRLKTLKGHTLWEFPMTTLRMWGKNLPVAGGGWMRVLPPALMRRAISRANRDGQPAVVYLHPWEVDPDQPRMSGAGRATTFRHYVGLHRMATRLERLLQWFRFGTMRDVLAATKENTRMGTVDVATLLADDVHSTRDAAARA